MTATHLFPNRHFTLSRYLQKYNKLIFFMHKAFEKNLSLPFAWASFMFQMHEWCSLDLLFVEKKHTIDRISKRGRLIIYQSIRDQGSRSNKSPPFSISRDPNTDARRVSSLSLSLRVPQSLSAVVSKISDKLKHETHCRCLDSKQNARKQGRNESGKGGGGGKAESDIGARRHSDGRGKWHEMRPSLWDVHGNSNGMRRLRTCLYTKSNVRHVSFVYSQIS